MSAWQPRQPVLCVPVDALMAGGAGLNAVCNVLLPLDESPPLEAATAVGVEVDLVNSVLLERGCCAQQDGGILS